MTDFKSKTPEGKTPDDLYRKYQTMRDNIPAPVYASIKSAAEQATHEESIELILQRAKAFQPSSETAKPKAHASSIFDQLKNRLFGESGRPNRAWGTAFASIALAAIALPMAINFAERNGQQDQLAYFDDCADCLSYIENAAVSTRSTIPGLNKLNPEQRYQARLGRIFADLKILQSVAIEAEQSSIDAQVKRLKALPARFYGPSLSVELSNSGIEYQDLVLAIQNDQNQQSASPIFLAAESLEIANITARRALTEQSTLEVASSFEEALKHFEQATQSRSLRDNGLAQNTLKELSQFDADGGNLGDQAQLKKIISLYTRALKSLGG